MILYRWPGPPPNFGDELNPLLWPLLLPDFFDQNPAVRFLGIGSVLDRRHSSQSIKLVAGAGYGGYEAKPLLDETWIIHWVRGPRTAAALGLPPRLGLGDPGSLVPGALGLPAASGHDIGFMPHFESLARGAWQQAADRAGLRLIDPRDPPLSILRAIGRCKLLLSEALHGIIVADAMRVPWVAVRPQHRVHRAKWLDWADSLDLSPRFRGLSASTPFEWAATSRLNAFHAGRVLLGHQEHRLRTMSQEQWVVRATRSLANAAQAEPQLSTDAALDRCCSRMQEAVQAIRANPMRAVTRTPDPRSRLPDRGDSAYQLTPVG